MAHERHDKQASDGNAEPAADTRGGPEQDLTVRRSEEEASAGVREREAGRVNVKKSVHTEREVVRVPKRREEVSVERVPVAEEEETVVEPALWDVPLPERETTFDEAGSEVAEEDSDTTSELGLFGEETSEEPDEDSDDDDEEKGLFPWSSSS